MVVVEGGGVCGEQGHDGECYEEEFVIGCHLWVSREAISSGEDV